MSDRILVVEDDRAILTGLSDLLASEGFLVVAALDGDEALAAWRRERPALILLDIMLPRRSGYDVCRAIRKEDRSTPIVMLTAKGQEVDKVLGLELGADDYVVKPFSVGELLARIRAALRRGALLTPSEVPHKRHVFGTVEVDLEGMRGTRQGEPFDLTPLEAALLECFLTHEGKVLDRNTLLETVWGFSTDVTTRTVDQHVVRLRQKIEENPGEPHHLQTVYGAGYRFVSQPRTREV